MKSTCPRGQARPSTENSNTNYDNADNVRNIMKEDMKKEKTLIPNGGLSQPGCLVDSIVLIYISFYIHRTIYNN
jgi:hypothetical protein